MIWLITLGILAVGWGGLRGYCFWRARRAEAAYPPLGLFVAVEQSRLHYLRKGTGRPVVLLHGSEGFLQDYALTLVDRLAQEYDVLAFDRPGHGYSAPPNEVATPRVQARLIHAALQQLGIVKPLLVGHSWSGALLIAYALEYPEESAGLTLLAPWVYAPNRLPPLLLSLPQIPLLGPLLTLIKRRVIRRNLARAFAPDPVPADYARMACALWQRAPFQTRVFAQENRLDTPLLEAFRLRSAEIRLPVVIVTGDSDRIVSPEQHAYPLHRILAHSKLITLPGTGHELPQTRPEAVSDAIRLCWQEADSHPAQATTKTSRPPESHFATSGRMTEPQHARELVFRYGWNATAYQILNPEMEYWFAADGAAVVGFLRRYRVRVTAGAPICAEARLAAVTAEFEQAVAREGERVCYFGAASRLHTLLQGLPSHSALVIGAQPVWNPQRWPEIPARNASLRAQLNRARNKGVRVVEWPVERANNHPDLQHCLDDWLEAHPLPTLHFLTEPVTLDRLHDRRLFVAEREETPVGFLIATPVPDRHGWLIEQIVRERSAPNGTAELLVDVAMCALGDEGFDYVTLGLAPLSRRSGVTAEPTLPWLRLLLAWARAHGRRFYNFDGLDAFKAKFRPDAWEPLFAISNEPTFSVRTLYAILAAFSDGPPVGTVAQALWGALRQELVWLRERQHRRSS